jgi:hypothetical protein
MAVETSWKVIAEDLPESGAKQAGGPAVFHTYSIGAPFVCREARANSALQGG